MRQTTDPDPKPGEVYEWVYWGHYYVLLSKANEPHVWQAFNLNTGKHENLFVGWTSIRWITRPA